MTDVEPETGYNENSDKSSKVEMNLQPEVATNIAAAGKGAEKKGGRKVSSVNVEADYLSMSSAQMKNHLSTIKNLVEENNHMKEQIQNKIQDANHFKFLANEYE